MLREQKNLRRLSNYLYTVSHVYRRLINFKAYQIKLDAWTVYPDIPFTEKADPDDIIQNYENGVLKNEIHNGRRK